MPTTDEMKAAVTAYAAAHTAGDIDGVVAVFDPQLDTPAARNAAQLVVALSLMGTALGFAVTDAGGRIREAFGKLGLGPRVALGAIGLAVLAWFIYILCAGFLSPLLQPDQEDVTRELGTNKDELGSIAVAAFLIVIAAPCSRHNASFSSVEAAAMTAAPICAPSSTAARPTPPAAPRTSSVSPACSAARSFSAWCDVP